MMTGDHIELRAGEKGTAAPEATIVIPQHDRTELTLAAVQSLRRCETRRWPIVVVDDGSSAESAAELVLLPDDVRVLRQPHRGVTAAWNLGLEHVTTPVAVLLNNDVLIDGTWVEPLIDPIRRGSARVSGVELRTERAVPADVLRRIGRSSFVAGWCWAFRTADARAIGGFDSSLWLYFSDTDLQSRLLADGELAIVGKLPLRHLGRQSTRWLTGRGGQWRADRLRFITKWSGDT